ncbi:MAG: outer membrane beta-barrel protein [candidate division Zixibacteria bacterium]|nr:outer membrane beta-barrel protein [candidate division Zixibacteria bacterium]
MRPGAKAFVLAVCLLAVSTSAHAFRFSVGAFGGLNMPIAQEDTESGTVFGVKGRVPLIGFLAVEPNFTYVKNGDAEVEVGGNWNETMTHQGGKYNSFGVDLVLGNVLGYKGFGMYGIFGLSSAKFQKDGIPDLTKSTYWLGLGFEYSVTDQISVDFRGKAFIFPYEDDTENAPNPDLKTSRKNGMVTVGLNYYFGFTE